MVNGRNAQTAHRGKEQASVEGAQLQQELRQQTEVVQKLQKPDKEFQEDAGNQIQQHDQTVQIGVQFLCSFDLFHRCVELVIDIYSSVIGGQMHLDGGVGTVNGHFFLDDHAVLDIVTAGVYLLAVDKAVQLGILGYTANIGCQQNMGNAEVGQTLTALLTDIAVNIGDLEGFLEQVGADISLPLEVGGDLRHGRKGADFSAVNSVAPCGVILSGGIGSDSEDHQQHTEQGKNVRYSVHKAGPVGGKKSPTMVIQDKSQRSCNHGEQQQNAIMPATAGDFRVGGGKENECDTVQPHGRAVGTVAFQTDGAVDGHHPDGDGCLIE